MNIKINVQFLFVFEHNFTPPFDNHNKIRRLRILIIFCLLNLLFDTSIIIEQFEYSINIIFKIFIYVIKYI